MARTKGMLNLSGNLEVNAGAPLDARTVVPTVADLTIASNFQYKYIGMPVVVQATGDMYILMNMDVTDIANWKKTGSGGGSSYTAGDGIDITNDEISVKAGSNLSFDSSGNLNATDTTYTAGDGIVIEDDEISTDNMPAADMSEIVTPLPSVMSRLPRYTTAEQIVAYWVDGKPIYQKVIMIPASITGNYQTTISSSLDLLIKCDVFGKDANNNIGFIPTGNPSASFNTMVYVSSSGDIVFTIGNSVTFHDTIIIAQYTKTTD